jgi:hypothetical protein
MTENELNPFAESAWAEEPQETQETTDSTSSSESNETNKEDESETSESPKASAESKSSTESSDGSTANESFDENSNDYSESDYEESEPQLEFKNELSQKVFESILSGNYEKAAPIIYEQTVLSNLDKLSEEEVLKLMIQYESPDRSQ